MSISFKRYANILGCRMKRSRQRAAVAFLSNIAMLLTAEAALAAECSLNSPATCSDGQICYAINVLEHGDDAEKVALGTSIVVQGPEMNPVYTACFGSAILSGIAIGGADRFARRAVSAFDDEYVAENCVGSGSNGAALAYYQDQFPNATAGQSLVTEAVSRKLICPGR